MRRSLSLVEADLPNNTRGLPSLPICLTQALKSHKARFLRTNPSEDRLNTLLPLKGIAKNEFPEIQTFKSIKSVKPIVIKL